MGQSKHCVPCLWEEHSELCRTKRLGRRNADADSLHFPGRAEERVQGWDGQWQQADEWLTSTGKGTHLERGEWPGWERWNPLFKAGRAKSVEAFVNQMQVKIIVALGRGRGEDDGAQFKHETSSGFTNGGKVKTDLEGLLWTSGLHGDMQAGTNDGMLWLLLPCAFVQSELLSVGCRIGYKNMVQIVSLAHSYLTRQSKNGTTWSNKSWLSLGKPGVPSLWDTHCRRVLCKDRLLRLLNQHNQQDQSFYLWKSRLILGPGGKAHSYLGG